MRIVALVSVRGSPGVTTTSMLLASSIAGAVVVEADLDGGTLAVRYGLGREPGLTTLAAAGDAGPDGWRDHAQDAGGVPVLVGPDAPGACGSLWRTAGDKITRCLVAADDGVAVVDAGRFRFPVPLVAASDLVALLVCPVAEHLVGLSHLLPTVRQAVRGPVCVVLVGAGQYGADEVERSLGVPVLGELPDDRAAAQALRTGGGSWRGLSRSRLVRATTTLGAAVTEALTGSQEVAAS